MTPSPLDAVRGFGVTFRQLFNWRTFIRGFTVAITSGHGFGGITSNVYQMPGAFLVHRDSSFAREGDVTTLLELPVLALVPAITPEPERRRERRRRIALDMAGTAVLVASVALLGSTLRTTATDLGISVSSTDP